MSKIKINRNSKRHKCRNFQIKNIKLIEYSDIEKKNCVLKLDGDDDECSTMAELSPGISPKECQAEACEIYAGGKCSA